MTDPNLQPAAAPEPAAPAAGPADPTSAQPTASNEGRRPAERWRLAAAVVLVAGLTAALTLAWNTQQRMKTLESELVRRQQDTGTQATEARTLARQAEATARETAAKLAILEARVAETALQRSQVEELIQSLARSRDENVLADLDAALRVAQQQSAITGSTEPLVLALRQAEERLARLNQARLERVRRAVAQDLDRARASARVDLALLGIRLDEAVRTVDELPLLADRPRVAGERGVGSETPGAGKGSTDSEAAAAGPGGAGPTAPDGWWGRAWALLGHVGAEARSLLRVSRVEHLEPLLVAPEQAFFLRENLKLRLLNARLALLSRQYDTAQTDLREAQAALARWFDTSQRRVALAQEQLRQVAAQARQVELPRPDATLAAIAALAGGTAGR